MAFTVSLMMSDNVSTPPAFLKTEAAQLKLSNRGEAGHQNIIEENLNCIWTFMIN